MIYVLVHYAAEAAFYLNRQGFTILMRVIIEFSTPRANRSGHVENEHFCLRLAQALLPNQRTVLVFDEAEGVFRGRPIFHRSLADKGKDWMNRCL